MEKVQKREEKGFGCEEWKRASPLRDVRYPSPEVGLRIDYGVSVLSKVKESEEFRLSSPK